MVCRDSKVDYFASSLFFFLLIIIKSGLLAGIRWSVCILKSHRSLCESFSRTGAGLCIYHLLVWLNLNFLHISQWITLPTQSCLALYSCCANLLHSLIIWLMVSSLSPHSLHLLLLLLLSLLLLLFHSFRVFHISIMSCFFLRLAMWQQVPFRLQDSSRLSCRSQQSCGLYGLDSSTDLQFHQSFFRSQQRLFQKRLVLLVSPSTLCYTAFILRWQDLYICLSFRFLLFSLWGLLEQSSSSYRAGSTDIPDPLSPLLPIVHRPR